MYRICCDSAHSPPHHIVPATLSRLLAAIKSRVAPNSPGQFYILKEDPSADERSDGAPPAYSQTPPPPSDLADLARDIGALNTQVKDLESRAKARDIEDEKCRADRKKLNMKVDELTRRLNKHQTFAKHQRYEDLKQPWRKKEAERNAFIDYKVPKLHYGVRDTDEFPQEDLLDKP